jgi:hypothetical protein
VGRSLVRRLALTSPKSQEAGSNTCDAGLTCSRCHAQGDLHTCQRIKCPIHHLMRFFGRFIGPWPRVGSWSIAKKRNESPFHMLSLARHATTGIAGWSPMSLYQTVPQILLTSLTCVTPLTYEPGFKLRMC